VSWNPLVKSKKSATTTTATRVASKPAYAFLTTMLPMTFADVSQASSAASSAS
jgi:hypothetical protein